MTDHGYDAFRDPYCYADSSVLRNKAGLRDEALLESFELEMTSLRAEEDFPRGRFGVTHYRAVHRHLFQDVYSWAGRYRTVRIAKGASTFCYPEHIASQMEQLFRCLGDEPFLGRAPATAFVPAAAIFLGELNAIHPFRDGNGRVQLSFLHMIAIRAGHEIELSRIEPRAFLGAMIKSFNGSYGPLERQLRALLV